jgi:hypothetical protein
VAAKTYSRRTGLRTQRLLLRARPIAWSLSLLICAHLGTASRAYGQDGVSEYQVKAAYLFNFLKFVEWPGDSSMDLHGPWVICVVGQNPFGDELAQAVSGKIVQGRELQIKIFQPRDDLRGCHVLFISASETKRLPSILTALHGASVLTVGDMDHFTESGGMIQFVTADGRVRFAIDVGATGRARLKVSSKLLSLARAVTSVERSATN